MKRAGHLYEKIIDRQNIETAIYNASKRKRNRPDVVRVLRSIDKHIEEIRRLLTHGEYVPSPFIEQSIVDNSSGKIRTI